MAAEAAARGAKALEELRPEVNALLPVWKHCAALRHDMLVCPTPQTHQPALLHTTPPPEQASTALYRSAVEWLEDAGKDAVAGDVFR